MKKALISLIPVIVLVVLLAFDISIFGSDSILGASQVALLFAAWKAPAWVKEIGAAGLAFSLFMIAISWYKAATAVEICKGAISPALLWGGLKCCMVTLIYGLIIYLVSLIIRIIRKPRL